TTGSWWGGVLLATIPGAIVYFIYRRIYLANQAAVEKQLAPRQADLQKFIAALEGEDNAADSQGQNNADSLNKLASSLSDNAVEGSCKATWAENWNRNIPSWREVAMILVPTVVGGFCGWRFAHPDFGPVFFQSVCAAVVPFEFMLFGRAYLVHRRHKDEPPKTDGLTRPNAPAIFMIVLTVVIGILAIAALFSFVRHAGKRGPGLEDISAFVEGDIDHIDDWLNRVMDDRYPSLAAIVVRDGEVVYRGAFGVEDKVSNRPATTDTQYNVASVTKVFTASLAVILHEQGVVDLDQPAVTYLPPNIRISTTPLRGATITLRQLASHTSGLPRRVPGQVQSAEGRYALEPARLYALLEKVELLSDPGESREYSNLGFGLLGHVLELAAEKPLEDLLQEHICTPMGLTGTAIEGNSRLRPAMGYGWQKRGGTKITHSLKERLAGSGGLIASTEDLGRFLMAQMKPGVFNAEMLEQFQSETKLTGGGPSATTLGWSIGSIEGADRILEKNGQRSNCSAWIGFAPKHKVAVAIVTNCGGPRVDPIGRKLLEQSIPREQRKLVSEDDYAKVAPFTGVRWEADQPFVCVHGTWSQLLSINAVPTSEIMEFANKTFRSRARKRFAEDLVEVLTKMGHQPDWQVTLELQQENGAIEQLQVLMPRENRDLLWKPYDHDR
ncbi:MAG: serine hydrolase domain-containing protein, partial [Planctomycetota bacterium]